MPEPLTEQDLIGDGWLPPRARFDTDAPLVSLNGEWAFRGSPSPDAAPDDVADPDLDDRAWSRVPVPSSLPMQGHGLPAYTNTRFPFPVDPPHVPDENPVGDHRLAFEWEGDDRAVLRFDGIDAAAEVWLNGVRLGSTAGSRLVHEFDVAGVLRTGSNLLAVRVLQWAPTSYLEDQDMWWLPGVFRDVSLQAAPAGGLQDVVVRTGWADGVGVLHVDAETRDGATAVVDVPALGLTGLAVGREHRLEGVPAWTAETPRLVDVVVRTAAERAVVRAGFRSIAIEDAQLEVNGRRLRFRGVNRHEHHPDLGRVVPRETLLEELRLMKRHGVNAIRTSHYPPHPDLPGLADEMGFWLIDECDLETHGFVHVDWRGNPSDDAAWEAAYLDRMRRTVARDRNHPSVIMWSLGNEAGTGRNLEAAARLSKRLDPERPVHYEGDWSSTYVDVYSRMYAHQDEVDAIGRQAEEPLPDAAADAHRRGLPFLLCEYVHAMGNGPGGISEYEAAFRRYPRTQGGFVWEWLEHGIRRTAPDGREFFAYGGDFGEELHDGNFVADGLVDADRRPRPGLLDWARAVAPVVLEVTEDRSGVLVSNGNDFAGLEGLELRWSLGAAFEGGGAIPLPEVPAGSSAVVALPAQAAEGLLTVSAVLTEAVDWAPAGHEVAWTQAGALPAPAAVDATAAPERAEDGSVRIGPARFDGVTGRLLSVGGASVPGFGVALWRAPTDNDRGEGTDRPGLPSDAEAWKQSGLHRLRTRTASVEVLADGLEVIERVGAAGHDGLVEVRSRWTSDGDAVRLDVEAAPLGVWPSGWARFGLEALLPWSPTAVSWSGLGPGQRYPDTGQAQRLGDWRVEGAAGMHTDYVKPQENGSRAGVTSMTLAGPGGGLVVEGDALSITVSPWTSAELDAAAHPVDLPPAGDRCRLVVDLAEHGIGTASCGPGVLPQHRLEARPVSGTVVLRPAAG